MRRGREARGEGVLARGAPTHSSFAAAAGAAPSAAAAGAPSAAGARTIRELFAGAAAVEDIRGVL